MFGDLPKADCDSSRCRKIVVSNPRLEDGLGFLVYLRETWSGRAGFA